jgi:CRISPR-associated protein Cmr4
MNARLLFTHALSPLHAGTGQGVGVIDLPIAREKATGIPYLPGSSVKGTLRDLCKDPLKEAAFGPETNRADEFAGAAQFADQRLLLLPTRSLSGTFAWITSPYLLRRFLRDAQDADSSHAAIIAPTVPDKKCLVVKADVGAQVGTKLKVKVGTVDKVVLEDLDLELTEDQLASQWAAKIGNDIFDDPAWRKMFAERFCIVSDDVLSFLLDTATEITARIKLREDAKSVQRGGLWYEEALPTETILYGLVLATPTGYHSNNRLDEAKIFDVVANSIEPVVQLGGKATVGRGLCRLIFRENSKQSATDKLGTATPSAETRASPLASRSGLSQSLQSAPPSPLSQTTVRTLGVKKPVV